MEIDQLTLFVDVYRSGSFAETARSRNADPSAVSRSVANLEKRLNVRLFNRTTRSMVPTAEGERLFLRTADLLDDLTGAIEQVSAASAHPAGLVRITASVSYGTEVLIPRLALFRQSEPAITFDLRLTDSRVDLLENQIDIAIRHGHLEDSSLVAKKLRDVRYLLVASANYLKARGAPETPEELADHEILTFPYEAFRSTWVLENRHDKQQITVPLRPSLTISNALALRKSIDQGLGLALLPDWLLDRGSLERVLPDWEAISMGKTSLWLVRPSRQYLPERINSVWKFLGS